MARQRFAFVLRLWLETEASEVKTGPMLRGSLELVEPKQVYYFSSFEQIIPILRNITGWENRPDSDEGGEEGEM
ncbi:MAG: hypothetical protein BroJett011_71850 [Chloroflexota bacterium]|nr:MAG: hypothetical protein BroJett011_71850 [Chloroflexota bacterium]